jgi:hypothetical protein
MFKKKKRMQILEIPENVLKEIYGKKKSVDLKIVRIFKDQSKKKYFSN